MGDMVEKGVGGLDLDICPEPPWSFTPLVQLRIQRG